MNTTIYTIYKITNTINNKIYIGVHKTTNPNDSYFGSGNAIKKSIQKYGKHNFTKEILFEYDNHNDAYLKEKHIVDLEFIKRKDTYNLTIGGYGRSDMFGGNNPMYGKHHTYQTKLKLSTKQLGKLSFNYGKSPSYETRIKMKESSTGIKNHQFNGYYITPWGKFVTSYDAETPNINYQTILQRCKNPDKIISKSSIWQSKYLKSLKESPLGKTWRDLGFWFEYIKL